MSPNDTSYQNKCHSRHHHHTAVLVNAAVGDIPTLRNHAEAEQRARAEQLAEESDYHKDDSVAKAVAETIKERIPYFVGHSECLQATHQDTVGDNQSDIHAQLHSNVVGKGFQNLAHERYQRSHYHQLHNDTDTHRYRLANQ